MEITAPQATASHRTRTDEYGSGEELEVTVSVRRLDPEDPVDADAIDGRDVAPVATPWKVDVAATVTTYGPGSAVRSCNGTDVDPDNTLWGELRAAEPSVDELQQVANDFIGYYRDDMEQRADDRARMHDEMEDMA